MDYQQEQFLRMQQYANTPKMPFYMTYPMQNIYMTELEYERDLERMKELYPEDARRIQELVDEECDKMEYEGSMMFDEYPDRTMLKLIVGRIYEKASAPDAERAEESVDAQEFRQGPPPGHGRLPGPPPDGGLGSLIEALLYNEMYRRRCRHKRCRRWW